MVELSLLGRNGKGDGGGSDEQTKRRTLEKRKPPKRERLPPQACAPQKLSKTERKMAAFFMVQWGLAGDLLSNSL